MFLSRIYTFLTIAAFGILYILTGISVLFVMIFTWMNAKIIAQYLTMAWAKTVFFVLGKKLCISGKEYISRNEKYILLANHGSIFDIVAIMSVYPRVSWFGHERLLKVPVFSRFLKMTDYVPFREPTVTNTRHMLEQLMEKSQSQTVALFPEGTRTTDGKINPFYRGFIYLFRTKQMPILPVTLNGFYDFKPKTRFYIDFGSKLEVVIHEPIPCDELINKTDREIIDIVKTRLESAYRNN